MIETYMAYCFSADLNVYVSELNQIIETVTGKESSDEARERKIRRYIEDFKKIGALDEDTRIVTRGDLPKKEERASHIPYSHYSFDLIPYDEVDDELKDIYRITKMMNYDLEDEKIDLESYRKYLKYFYTDGITLENASEKQMFEDLMVINDTIKLYYQVVGDEEDQKQFKHKYNNLYSLFSSIKAEHGFYTRNK